MTLLPDTLHPPRRHGKPDGDALAILALQLRTAIGNRTLPAFVTARLVRNTFHYGVVFFGGVADVSGEAELRRGWCLLKNSSIRFTRSSMLLGSGIGV